MRAAHRLVPVPVRAPVRSRRRDRARRRVIGALAAVAAATLTATTAASPVAAAPCWRPPVTAPVIDPFRAPACTWCAGNRGIEYRVAPGTTIRAAATGHVTFVGAVAGVHYLVVRSPDGRRQTYGRLDPPRHRWRIGDVVVAGSRLGTAGTGGGPTRAGSFHFGVRVGDTYVDPAPLLGRIEGRRRLVPTTADRPRPAPAEVRCGSGVRRR